MSNDVSFEGVGQDLNLTFKSALVQNQDEGKTVAPDASTGKTIIVCAAEKPFLGVLGAVEKDGTASVVKRGAVVNLAYDDGVDAAPALGYSELAGDGAGGCKTPHVAGTGKKYWVVDIDTSAKTIAVLLED